MSKKKLITVVISAILTVLATVLGCVFGIDVEQIDFQCREVCYNAVDTAHGQPYFLVV